MIRTDIHRPSAIQPKDYKYVAFEVVPRSGEPLADAMWQLSERAKIHTHMKRTKGTYSQHAHGGNCMVCGNANAIYTVLFHHESTNTYVRMGQDCAEKVDAQYPREAFTRWRKTAEDWRSAQRGKNKARVLLADAGLTQAWEIYETDVARRQAYHQASLAWRAETNPSERSPVLEDLPFEEDTISDIVAKLVKYGSVTDKQMVFVRKLVGDIGKRAEREAARAAEMATAAPVPVTCNRIEIAGEVMSTKVVDTDFGPTTKMLVKTEAGWKAWGTMPRGLNAQRGDRIRIMAKIEPSRDDPKFGFFSRPTVKGK